ncbi:hypothetical protein ABPG74_013615 [Tetrahymena malaccensis]
MESNKEKQNFIEKVKERYDECINLLQGMSVTQGKFIFINNYLCQVFKVYRALRCKDAQFYEIHGFDILNGEVRIQTLSDPLGFNEANTQLYQLIDIQNEQISLLSENNQIREDLNLPQNKILKEQIINDFKSDKVLIVQVKNIIGIDLIASFFIQE